MQSIKRKISFFAILNREKSITYLLCFVLKSDATCEKNDVIVNLFLEKGQNLNSVNILEVVFFAPHPPPRGGGPPSPQGGRSADVIVNSRGEKR